MKDEQKLKKKIRRKKQVVYFLFFLILFVGGFLVYWIIPFSPMKANYQTYYKKELTENEKEYGFLENEIFTEDEIKKLPISIQQFFRTTNLIGKPKIYVSHIKYDKTNFRLSKEKPVLKINYQHYNMLNHLNRIALIDTKFMGIPFEGLDHYQNGHGSMRGMLGKTATLFHSTGVEMDISSLVTCLSEFVFLPTIALQEYVRWETIDDFTAKATMNYNNHVVHAIFKTNHRGEIIQVETDDRYMDDGEGNINNYKWVIYLEDYITENGMKHPSKAKAIWKLPKEDYLYFDGSGIKISYNIKQ